MARLVCYGQLCLRLQKAGMARFREDLQSSDVLHMQLSLIQICCVSEVS